jgi:hypothetical protein
MINNRMLALLLVVASSICFGMEDEGKNDEFREGLLKFCLQREAGEQAVEKARRAGQKMVKRAPTPDQEVNSRANDIIAMHENRNRPKMQALLQKRLQQSSPIPGDKKA